MDKWLIKLSNKNILFLSAILTIVVFLSLRGFDSSLHTVHSPNGIVSFEFAKTIETSDLIISSWNANAKMNAGLSLGIDFLFLFAYSIFFVTACLMIANNFNQSHLVYKIGIVLAYLLLIAGICDAIENIALIKLLLGSTNEIYPLIAFYFASIKFSIIAVGILYIIPGYLYKLIKK